MIRIIKDIRKWFKIIKLRLVSKDLLLYDSLDNTKVRMYKNGIFKPEYQKNKNGRFIYEKRIGGVE